MKLHKLFHVLAVLALVACAPTLGPSSATPTTAPGPVSVLSTITPAAAAPTPTDTHTANIFSQASPTPAAPSSTSPAVAAAASPTQDQPQWGHQTKSAGCQVQGPFPDPACTPGDIFLTVTTAQVCVSGYSSSVRNVSASEKDAVNAEYGITSHGTGQYEVDHFVSLELGGSNDISNLFPEAANPTPGFHEKDRVENYLHSQVCNGAITLPEAQREIATNWLAVYQSLAPGAGSSPTPTRVRITFTPAPVAQGTATQAKPAAPTATEAQQVTPTDTEVVVIAPSDTPIPPPAPTDTQAAARVRVGALCNDGTSSSATGSGACSHHKGVQCWKYSDGTCTNP